jgi:DNA-binding TFAR19-related protein (PDSD5 family)
MLEPEEAVALERLVIDLRDSGKHRVLEGVFKSILEEIEREREMEANGGSPWAIKKD